MPVIRGRFGDELMTQTPSGAPLTLPWLAELAAHCDWPDIVLTRISAADMQLELAVNDDLHWFSGHFPGTPILPGIVQTHWAATLSKILLREHQSEATENSLQTSASAEDEFRCDNLKFLEPVLPNTIVRLFLTVKHPTKVAFEYQSGNAQDAILHSKGTCVFAGLEGNNS